MRSSQTQTWELVFNFVNPEVVMDPRIREHVKTYMEAYRTNGIVVNAVLRSPDFAKFSRLHPESVNKDENVSMDYIVQEPLSLHAIQAAHAEGID